MKRIGCSQSPCGLKTGLAAAAFSAFFLFSASEVQAPPADRTSVPERHPSALVSEWSGGECSFEDGNLAYASGRGRAAFRTDARITNPTKLICSEDFTVILSPASAVVALGARSTLAGIEMLGSVGGTFTMANSYSIDIAEPAGEGIIRSGISGDRLTMDTAKGKRWVICLNRPDEWLIYGTDHMHGR